MRSTRSKNLTVVLFAVALMVPTSVGVVYAPTLYRLFCSATGFGGTTQRSIGVTRSTVATTKRAAPTKIRVRFDANVAPGLDWEFRPERHAVDVVPGQPVKVYYYARNRSDRTIVARATFNVTPYKAAPYFFKIQCFCFTNERLGPGQSARMPVVLYVDEQMLKDVNTKDVDDITLSYTFFRSHGAVARKVGAARDLKAGSKTLDAELRRRGTATFDNDAIRE